MILWSLSYILYFDYKTFAPQCDVRIVVFIVLHINANFPLLLIIMLSLCLLLWLFLLFCFFMWSWVFIRPSLRRDVLWYTNVRLSVRPLHMSRSNLANSLHISQSYWNWWSYGLCALWDFIHQIVGDFSYIAL